jgi:nucleotide-binding universal stress UspA family protein
VVVHPTTVPAEGPPRVVVGLDDSEPARAALSAAVAHATAIGAQVDAVVAYQTPDYWVDLYAVVSPLPELQAQAQARGETAVTEVAGAEALASGLVRVVTVEGSPARVLVAEAEGARLLVVGSRSHNALEGVVLGSVALRCVMHAPCPVLVVRATGGPASVPSPRAATDAVVPTG